MDILSLIGWRATDLEGADQDEAGRSRPPIFNVGDQLQGRVARLLHQKLAVVELLGGRLKAVAELNTPLDPGQHLHLKVTATTPRLTLQTLATASANGSAHGSADGVAAAHQARPASLIQLLDPSQARRLIGELKTLAAGLEAASGTDSPQVTKLIASLERLTGHLTPLDPGGEPETLATRLLAHVRDGGLFFEQKLVAAAKAAIAQATAAQEGKAEAAPPAAANPSMAQTHPLLSDLKPHLQRLLIQLPVLMEALDPGQQPSEEGGRLLWTTVTGLLDGIDAGQKQLTEQRPDEALAVLRHSMWIEGRDKPMHFNVYLPRKGGGGRKGSSATSPMVSLLLDLERFGTLRVDIRERPSRDSRQLTVTFWTQTEAVREDIETVGAPLANILEHLYPQVVLKVALAPDRVAAFEKADEAPRNGRSDRSRLDIRV
jgi:hypothetical protein